MNVRRLAGVLWVASWAGLAGSVSGQLTELDDHFDGGAGAPADPSLWNTRDEDSGAGVVDFGGEAQPGTNGRGVVEQNGCGSLSLEGDLFPFAAWGELGLVSVEPIRRPASGEPPLYLYFWNARSDQYRSKIFLGLSPRADSVALGVIREGYGWSIQGGQIEVAIEDHEYAGGWLYIPANQFYPVRPRPDEGGPDPSKNVAHDFRLIVSATGTQLQYKEIYSSTWLSPDWSLFGGPPASARHSDLWIVVGGRVGDPAEIDHTDFLIDRIQLSRTDYGCQDGGPCPSRTPPLDDDFSGPPGASVDACSWSTRDMDTGAGVVDEGGEAVPGTNGRGTVQVDGNGHLWLQGDLMSPEERGQLGMVSLNPVRRPQPGEDPVYVYFWNARAERYRSTVILGLSDSCRSVSVGQIRRGYGWSIVGGGIQVAVQDNEYNGQDLGIADEFYPVNPLENEGGPDPASNIAHDFRLKVTAVDTRLEYKKVNSRTWLAPDWEAVGGPPPSANVATMWVAIGAKVGLPENMNHTDFLIDRIQITTEDLNCQGAQCCAPADFDCDGDVDVSDFAYFQACFNGPGQPPAREGCEGVNLDADLAGDVDVSDFARFQACFNGAGRPPAPGCT